MAGGIWSGAKVRPGTYVNLKNGKAPKAAKSTTGVVVIPLIGYDYGPREVFIKLPGDNPDSKKELLGRSVYDDESHMRLIRFAAMNASTIYVYIPKGGTAASTTFTVGEASVKVTAKYPGALGNKIKIAVVEDPSGGYDFMVVLDGSTVENFEGIKNLSAVDSKYITLDKTDVTLSAAIASKALAGGTDDSTNDGASDFLNACEKLKFNTMLFPLTDEGLHESVKSKIKYIRNSIGWKCKAVVPNYAADYEGIINQTNAAIVDGRDLTVAETAAWRAGLDAAASYTKSNTYAVFEGATGIVGGGYTNEKAEEAIKNGESFLTIDEHGNVVLEYDINSKVTFDPEDPTDINKNRPMKVYDTFANDCLMTFTPNKFNNGDRDWDAMEGIGRGMLQNYERDGALKNVDTNADFVVDRENSTGDAVYINVALQPVESAEKYYMTVIAK